MLHLAIFSPGSIEKIFNGQKSIESRFSKVKCQPFGLVSKGDIILMKKSGGQILGYFIAGKVKYFEKASKKVVKQVFEDFKHELAVSNEFISNKIDSKFITLIWITKPARFRVPISVKKRNMLGWVCLGTESQNQITFW